MAKDIKQVAIKLLARRGFFCNELQQKLEDKGFKAYHVEAVLRELAQFGALDDELEANRLIDNALRKGRGYYWIAGELKRRKADPKHLEKVDLSREQESAQQVLTKQRAKSALRRKAFLYRRGYRSEVWGGEDGECTDWES